MKLYEISSNRRPPSTMAGNIPVIYPKGTVGIPDSNIVDMEGDGFQAEVYRFPRRPNVVVKYTNIRSLDDSYVEFVNLALDNPNNPFFPRIYNAKIYLTDRNLSGWKAKEGRGWMLIVQMERLHKIDSNELAETALHLMNSLGINIKDINELFTYFGMPQRRRALANETKNPQFKRALQELEPFLDDFGSDLHEANVMIRLTSSGPQLVIIDPFQPIKVA